MRKLRDEAGLSCGEGLTIRRRMASCPHSARIRFNRGLRVVRGGGSQAYYASLRRLRARRRFALRNRPRATRYLVKHIAHSISPHKVNAGSGEKSAKERRKAELFRSWLGFCEIAEDVGNAGARFQSSVRLRWRAPRSCSRSGERPASGIFLPIAPWRRDSRDCPVDSRSIRCPSWPIR